MLTDFLTPRAFGVTLGKRHHTKPHREGLNVVSFRSGGELRITFKAIRGSTAATPGASIVVALERYGTAGGGTYRAKVYYNGSNVGGNTNGSARGGLDGLATAINANTTGGLNSNIVATVVSEVNAAFNSGTDLADGNTGRII
jgi:hypothetical protein